MVTNKDEKQGNVTTNAKGNSIHGLLNYSLFKSKNLFISLHAKNKAAQYF